MFTSLDIKNLTTRIKEKEKELEKPIANGQDFIPLLKNIILFCQCFNKEKNLEFEGLKYRIHTRAYHSYSEELGEEPTKMVETTFEVIRISEEKIYKEQNKIDKLLKRQLVLVDSKEHVSTIMYIKADINNEYYFDSPEDIKIKNIEIIRINVEEFEILYAINDYLRRKVREYFEQRLHSLEEKIALKQLSPLPENINFEV